MVATTIAVGVAAARAKTMYPWSGIVTAVAGVLALPAGFVTYIPHGAVLVLAIAGAVITSTTSGTRTSVPATEPDTTLSRGSEAHCKSDQCGRWRAGSSSSR